MRSQSPTHARNVHHGETLKILIEQKKNGIKNNRTDDE